MGKCITLYEKRHSFFTILKMNEKIKIYCMKCRKHTDSDSIEKIDLENKFQVKAKCLECNSKKCRYVSKQDVDKI